MLPDTLTRQLGQGPASQSWCDASSRPPCTLAKLIRSAASREQASATAAVQASRIAIKATRSATGHPAEHTVAATVQVSDWMAIAQIEVRTDTGQAG